MPNDAPADAATAPPPAVAGVVGSLDQVAAVLARIDTDRCTASPTGQGSIGGHVRHCLDHVRALLNGLGTGEVDYDHRDRGTPVEADPAVASNLLAELRSELLRLGIGDMDRRVRVLAMVDGDGTPHTCESTVGRELLFALSHTVHHQAIMTPLLERAGIALPGGFGYAPSTIAYQRSIG